MAAVPQPESAHPRRRGNLSLGRAAAVILAAFVVAVIALALEGDPVAESNQRLRDYYQEKGIDREAERNPGAVATGQEGPDAQLPAGATPGELADRALPASVDATDEGVRSLFAATLGGRGRGGQAKNELVSVSCTGGTCEISYHPDGPGLGRVIESQGPLWRGLVKDPNFAKATIISTPAKGRGGAKVSISCTRDAVAKVGTWGVQATPAIRRNCEVSPSK
jgi:hypothetical protein